MESSTRTPGARARSQAVLPWIAAGLVVAGSGTALVEHLHLPPEPFLIVNEGRIDQRYVSVRDGLPDVERVRYLTDVPPGHERFGPLLWQAQYAVAPVLLDPAGAALPWALVNVDDPSALERVAGAAGYRIVKRDGPVAIARRVESP
jgi:hypothetical protein